MKKMVKGELTAFLSLVFILLISLIGAVLESVSIQVMKNERRADAARAVESVFAEYQRDLLEKYEIFALDESYESEAVSESAILNRMSYYGAENMDKEIIDIRFLTDDDGKAFYDQAVLYEKEKTGVSAIEELAGKSSVWKEQENQAEQYEKEDTETSFELERMLQEEDQKLPEEGNPIPSISNLKSGGLLNLVIPDGFQVSGSVLDSSELTSVRELQKGHGNFREKEREAGDAIFFNLYLMEQFQNAVSGEKERAMQYELEYLIAGKSSDAENLEAVIKKLCNIRFAGNYSYLLSDAAKQAEAEAAAAAMCTLLAVPGITEVVKQAFLLAWAYGEGIVDVKTLLAGKRVPLIKSAETWQLSWQNLLTLGETQSVVEGQDTEGGYSYEKYLQVLLMLQSREKLTMRALDLAEQNLRIIEGKNWFRADACVVAARFSFDCGVRREIHYRFSSEFQYY